MSSPSAPPSSDITRQHTPAEAEHEEEDELPEEQLPEKLKFLLNQSTIYSTIIAQQLAKATADRQKQEERLTRRQELKQVREIKKEQQAPTKLRETRRGVVQPTKGRPARRTAATINTTDSSSDDEEVIVASRRSRQTSLLSSQSDTDNEQHKVKVHDFEQDNDSKAAAKAPPISRSARSSARQSSAQTNTTANANGKKNGRKSSTNGKHAVKQEEAAESSDSEDEADQDTQKAPLPAEASQDVDRSRQPALVTGATMKSYQVAGMEWLISLYENGLNGILADEMGLGKTLQTIAFLAHLRGRGVWGPFLVCCPLSTLANWVNEFERFTPDIPVVLYHGTPQERAHLRESRLSPPRSERSSSSAKGKTAAGKKGGKKNNNAKHEEWENTTETFPIVVTSYELVMNDRKFLAAYDWKYLVIDESHRLKNLNCKLIRELMSYKSANRLLLTGTPLQNNLEELWSLLNFLMPDIFDDLDAFKSWFDIDVTSDTSASHQVVTKLHAILKPFLLRRIKREVEKSLPPKKEYLLSAPLTVQQKNLYDAVIKRQIRDFLLTGNHEKKEELPDGDTDDDEVMASLTNGKNAKAKAKTKGQTTPKTTPKKKGTTNKRKSEAIEEDDEEESKNIPRANKRTKGGPSSYLDDDSDDELWLEKLDDGTARDEAENFEERRFGKSRLNMVKDMLEDDEDEDENSTGNIEKRATAKIKSLKLSNMVMQLRKVVNHPWLFDWPMDPKTGEYVLDDRIVTSSGKMMLLDRLLAELFKTGHKVLVYSQFTTQLDIIEDWAVEWKGWNICRIDGKTSQVDRRAQLKDFNDNKSKKAPHLFLLSTRSGGVGINLVGADTVILFDSDWNPQMDLQAMDRVHRLGQTKPCLIFRLVTSNTIEARMLERAGNKRKLEALVIGSGKYTASAEDLQDIFTGKTGGGGSTSAAGLAASMFADEMRDLGARQSGASTGAAAADKEIRVIQDGEDVISTEQLMLLLDRSDEAMKRGRGWKAETDTSSKAFEVIETVAAEPGEDDGDEEMASLFKHESRKNTPKKDESDTE